MAQHVITLENDAQAENLVVLYTLGVALMIGSSEAIELLIAAKRMCVSKSKDAYAVSQMIEAISKQMRQEAEKAEIEQALRDLGAEGQNDGLAN